MNIRFVVFSVVFLVIAVSCSPINNCLPSDSQTKKCGANACIVQTPRSGNHCAASCDFKGLKGRRPLACTKMEVSPGCDPLPGFAFMKGQSGDAVRIELCDSIAQTDV